ncbi:MAG: hypothetical protein ACR2F8_00995 [Caulobacteraceae bacterium]
MQQIRILPLGGCLLHRPLGDFGKLNYNVRARVGTGGQVRENYSFSEMIQFVRMLRGEIVLPPEIKELAGMDARFEPLPGIGDFAGVDVVLLEPSTPVDIVFGDYLLNRTAIIARIVQPIRDANPEPKYARMTNYWMTKGLYAGDVAVQESLGGELAALVTGDTPLERAARAVLIEARAIQRDVAEGMGTLRAMIDRPMGVLTFIFQYLPDGRPVSWPAGFRDDVLAAATHLNLPVFEPWKLVEQYGVAATLKDDLRHYKDEFLPTVAQAIVDFAGQVRTQKPAAARAVA